MSPLARDFEVRPSFPLEQRFQISEYVADGRGMAAMATETVARVRGMVVRALSEGFHCRVVQFAGADFGRVEAVERKCSSDHPGRPGHDVLAANVGGIQHVPDLSLIH